MSFQAYLDTIKAKTGKGPEEFTALAGKAGLATYHDLFVWLKSEHGLGHGHANAMAHVILGTHAVTSTQAEQIARHFAGSKAHWRAAFDRLVEKITKLGSDVSLAPTSSYVSILRGSGKIAIVQVTSDRMDIGIKLKGAAATERFAESGKWNAMVTHRVQVNDPKEIDAELMQWLRKAYDKAG